ncbi:hypothetical protein F4781DRAFT_361814 [Annulohypoxylon bovei var. microspora]|nr:hypothetical protein F4781DRAFT_361814 [Annulohypoxylon bovei var. microspora]
MSVIPFILAGQFEEVGKAFSEAVKPDFEVVYFTTSPQSALTDIPLVLKGEIPTPSSKVGSGNLAHGTPKAVVVGAQVYDDAWLEAARQELRAAGKRVPFLKPDTTGAQGGGSQGDRAQAAAERVAKALRKLEGEGKLDGEDDGVYIY